MIDWEMWLRLSNNNKQVAGVVQPAGRGPEFRS